MNNEPVAWITTYDLERLHHYDCWVNGEKSKGSVPLYTHPVKELTDEEIIAIANKCLVGATAWHNPDLDPIEFAKAILRKAQEK